MLTDVILHGESSDRNNPFGLFLLFFPNCRVIIPFVKEQFI